VTVAARGLRGPVAGVVAAFAAVVAAATLPGAVGGRIALASFGGAAAVAAWGAVA
jgi:hypothetical protein